ncbi:D-alanyl-D-alanine carboxypeptidase family protein [Haliea atlantica]|nr:serine-type D-Ala-D-Ala carboxypeptidase [Haliea sp.]
MMRSLFVAILFLSCAAKAAAVAVVPTPPQLSAKAYFLMDADSGAVLAEHNADLPLPPASLAKMMTAYVLASEIESGRIDAEDQVPVSRNAWSQNPVFAGSSLMWIEPGKPVTVGQLERGIVVASGNDATVAIAEHVAGSEAAFADMMNAHAEALGMHNSHFENSHGLPAEGQVVTARDLALLAQGMIQKYPEHYALYKLRDFTYNDIRQYNRNTLLREDPSVDGIKTGYTSEAGYGLAASAERDGMRLISVVMGTRSPATRKNESRSLLNYGFRFFETVSLLRADEAMAEPRVWKGVADQVRVGVQSPLVLTIPRGRKDEIQSELALEEDLVAPLAAGDALGTVRLLLEGEVLHEGPVVALEAVEPAGFFARLWDSVLMWFSKLFKV